MTPLQRIEKAIGESRMAVFIMRDFIPTEHPHDEYHESGDAVFSSRERDLICCRANLVHEKKCHRKLRDALEVAVGFIRGNLVCLGERHDCPSCNGQNAEDTLDDLADILDGGKP